MAETTFDYTVPDDWGDGFIGNMAVTAGDTALDGWTIEFRASFDIVNLWNAEIVSHVGDHYVLRNAAWNGDVGAGDSVSFGFQAATDDGGSTATDFVVNGVPVGEPEPVVPSLVIGDATVTEGDDGAAVLSFPVTLSSAAASEVSVAYSTADGSAVAGSDYTAAAGTLTFAPGETSKTIEVRVTGDQAHEIDETLTVTLSDPVGATLGDTTATGTIVDDDPAPGLPELSIDDVSVVEGDPEAPVAAQGWFSTSGNQIVDADGNMVQIAGVNWFGFETPTFAPHGLWTRGYAEMMDQMVDLGFNTIRLPFSSEMLHTSAAPNGIDFSKNPDLAGLSALEVMDRIVDYAGDIGLRVILDHHRSTAGAGASGNGLWHGEGGFTEADWIANWQMLAERYADDPTVIGADLHNEPYNGTWGGGGTTDWARAAEAAGNAVGEVNPNWLIFVEGVGSHDGDNYWWGGNLKGVQDRPISLDVADKLVYSAHDYGNSVFPQPWFQGDDFAADLPAKFDEMWGYIYREDIAPVLIGEFGTRLEDPKDAPWFEALTSYMAGDFDNDGTIDIDGDAQGISWTYWSWNPNSSDTGGILTDDWSGVHEDKLAYLEPIQFDWVSDGGGDDGTPTVPTNEAVFTVSLSEATSEAVSVDFHTEPGTADATDFRSVSGTITFEPGEVTKTVAVAIEPDRIGEADETFKVVLSDPIGATIARVTGTGTIVDDDGGGDPEPPGEPDPSDEALAAFFEVIDAWDSGFNLAVEVENAGDDPVSGWRLEIDMPYEIADIWNAEILSHDNGRYVIGSADWNGTIGADQAVSFGLIGTGSVDPAMIDLFV